MTQEKINSRITSVKMRSYQAPSIIEQKNKNLVLFGEKNLFPFKMIDFYNDSPTHNAIVNGKVGYVCGQGLVYKGQEVNKQRVQSFINRANKYESWDELLKKIALDYELFNGYSIEVVRIAGRLEFYHIDFARVRKTLNAEFLAYSDNWITEKGKQNARPDIREYELFSFESDTERSLIYHADYRPNMDYYPLPTYQGSIAAIETDVEINNYWVNEIKNGFSSGTLLTFNNGVPQTDEEIEDVEKRLKEKTTGTDNAGNLLVNFAASKENAPTIDSLSGNDLAQRYEQLAQTVQQNIFIGHRITSPMLFGVKTEGQLGGRNEIDTAYEMFKKTYVEERQQTLLRTVNKLCFKLTGVAGIEISEYRPIETKIELSESTIVAALKPDELRALVAEQTGLELLNPEFKKFESEADAENEILRRFELLGSSQNDYDIVSIADIDYSAANDPREDWFDTDISTLEKGLLSLIKGNSKMNKAEMAKALGSTLMMVHNAIIRLQDLGLVKKSNGLVWGLAKSGENLLKIIGEPRQELQIMYRYNLRTDAPRLAAGGKSRPFCRAMMSMNRLWSRQEIDLLRNDMEFSGYAPQVTNVWLARGGWYRPQGEGSIAVPYCRHIWEQVVVRKK